jgi:hypothetical protein
MNMKNQELELPIENVPMNENTLADFNYYRAKVNKTIDAIKSDANRLACSAMELDLSEARLLGAAEQVRDIQYCATGISQYIGIVEMLLFNLSEDMRFIDQRRKEFRRGHILKAACLAAEQKEQMKREADAKRIAAKRASVENINPE